MVSRSQKYRLGFFIVLMSVMLIILLIVIGTGQILQKKDIYYISYKDISVSGLEIGSPVKYLGLGVGTIKDIKIDPEDISRIIITIAIKPGTPIKKDTRADIELMGITGLKMIEIRGGSNAATLLEPGEFIPAGGSTSELISGKAEIIAEKVERLVNNLNQFSEPGNMNKIIDMADNADKTFRMLNTLLSENQNDIRRIVNQTDMTTARLDTITRFLIPTARQLEQRAIVDTLNEILSNINQVTHRLRKANLEGVIEELARALDRTNQLITTVDHDLERGSENLYVALKMLRSTLTYLDDASRKIDNDPSILLRGTKYEDLPDEDLDR
jgi:phospholipid/cholesterol/gamma-HCH transport system substrate-binding protein